MTPGDSTRAVHAGDATRAAGTPFLPGPVFAAPYHLPGPADASPYGYGRYANPTWTAYEAALGHLEGGESVVFASGMAACTAVAETLLQPGDALVLPADGYYNMRTFALDHLGPRGVEVRLVPTEERAIRAALTGAALVWVETPSNPGLDTIDLGPLAADVHAAGGRLAVDATLATPLRLRALDHGADVVVASASKHLTGHSDLVLGHAATRDADLAATLRTWRGTTGAIAGPLEVWLAHRSLATLAIRLERQEAVAAGLLSALAGRREVADVRYPGFGSVVCFTLRDQERADAFLRACALVADATSFGGVHSSAERRARWGTDDVHPGWIRFSCGIEDPQDVVADVLQALDGV